MALNYITALETVQAARGKNDYTTAFLKRNFSIIPRHFRRAVNDRYIQIFNTKTQYEADMSLLEIVNQAAGRNGLLASDDSAIILYAKECAKLAYIEAAKYQIRDIKYRTRFSQMLHKQVIENVNSRFDIGLKRESKSLLELPYLIKFAHSKKVAPPSDKLTLQGQRERLLCEKWWRRALRKAISREVESLAIDLGLVSKQRGIYASDETVQRRRQQKRRNRDLLKTIKAVNDMGDEYTLAQLSDLGVSNPELRRNELMTRIAGFDKIAVELNHAADFYTLTCPSKYHAVGYDGSQNKKYQNYTPKEAQQFLAKTWARVRAYLAKRGVKVYGFRVAEAHHDGTPHWHMVLFYEQKNTKIVRQTIRNYWLGIRNPFLTYGEKIAFASDYSLYCDGEFRVKKNTGICLLDYEGGEAGASEHRFKVEPIDRDKGNAAGYLAKYISKNINAHGMDEKSDFEGGNVSSNVKRVDAWAACWGIRQFQQIGGAPVGVWRELRRLGAVTDTDTGILKELQAACDNKDWALYTTKQGGATVARKDLVAKVARVWFDGLRTLYDGYGGERVQGVESVCGSYEKTRLHTWFLKNEAAPLASWSSVNNCNQLLKEKGILLIPFVSSGDKYDKIFAQKHIFKPKKEGYAQYER